MSHLYRVAASARAESRRYPQMRPVPSAIFGISIVAMGGMVGLILGDHFLAIVGLLAAICISLIAGARRVGAWPLAVVGAYCLLSFVGRPIAISANIDLVSTTAVISPTSLQRYLSEVLVIVIAGLAALLLGWYARPEGKLRGAPLSPPSPVILFLCVLFTVLGSALVLGSVGGVINALSNLKVIRESVDGQRAPMLLIWVGQFLGLLVASSAAATRGQRFGAAVTVVMGSVPLLMAGSRGSALPAVVALLVVFAMRPSGLVHGEAGAEVNPHAGRRLVRVLLPVLMLMLIFGAYKQNTAPSDGESSASLLQALSEIGTDEILNQVKDADYFALIIQGREILPETGDLFLRVLQFPFMALPASWGIPKPRPYDFDVRAEFVGGIVETGLPASLFGELWLIGGIAGVVLACVPIGALLRAIGDRLELAGTAAGTYSAVVLGWMYMFLSRPLVMSLSRLLLLTVCFGCAVVVYRWFSRSKVGPQG